MRNAAISGLFLVAIIVALSLGRNFFLPVALAVTLALMLRPVVRLLHRIHIPESLGAGIVVGGVIGLLVVAGTALFEPAMDWARRAPETLRDAGIKLRQLQRSVEDFDRAAEEVEKLTESDGDRVPAVQIQEEDWQTTLARFTADALGSAAITVALLYFLLATRARLLHKALAMLVSPEQRANKASVVTETEQQVSRYLFTISVINILLGVAVAAAMWAWGMPNAVLWGVMAALLNFVPYLGAMVGVAITLLVAAVSFEDLRWVGVPLTYLTLTSVEGTFVTPSVLGRNFSLDPVVVLLWLVFWGWLWGIGGALLAMPMLVMLRIISGRAPALRTVARLLSNEDAPRAGQPSTASQA